MVSATAGGRNSEFGVEVGLVTWTGLLYAITYIALLGLTLAGSKVKVLTSLATDFTVCA